MPFGQDWLTLMSSLSNIIMYKTAVSSKYHIHGMRNALYMGW